MASTVHADSPAQLAEAVRSAADRGQPVADYGVAHAGLGHRPPDGAMTLAQRGGVIEHYERDFVVRVAGGCPMGRLQEALAANGQFLPLEADDDLTISEVIAHNVYGPLRSGFGAARDLLLGLAFTDGLGREVRVGGRTVKNVAGLDLFRFMAGSLGEFGIIHEATLKTAALPEQVALVDLPVGDLATLDQALPHLPVSDAAPRMLSLHRAAGAWRLRLGYLGPPSACRAQVAALRQFEGLAPAVAQSEVRELPWARFALDSRNGGPGDGGAWQRTAAAKVHLGVSPGVTGRVVQAIDRSPLGSQVRIEALPDFGRIVVGGHLDAEQAIRLDALVTDLAQTHGGFRVWHARPESAREAIAPFGAPRSDWPVLLRIKRALDPRLILNPGRRLPVREGP